MSFPNIKAKRGPRAAFALASCSISQSCLLWRVHHQVLCGSADVLWLIPRASALVIADAVNDNCSATCGKRIGHRAYCGRCYRCSTRCGGGAPIASVPDAIIPIAAVPRRPATPIIVPVGIVGV